MKFLVIYKDTETNDIYTEELETHKTALAFIEEVVFDRLNTYGLLMLIHGACLEY